MNKKDLPAMYSTVFRCLLVVLHVFGLYCITTVHKTKSSYEGSNSGYAIKPKKTVKRQADTETQWNTSQVLKSFLFISLKEKLYFTLFSIRRSQNFISYTKSLIFNGRL